MAKSCLDLPCFEAELRKRRRLHAYRIGVATLSFENSAFYWFNIQHASGKPPVTNAPVNGAEGEYHQVVQL